MDFCSDCGSRLIEKELDKEGQVPYCQTCQAYRFPHYHVAMSALVFDETGQRILLIQQYGSPNNVLGAGYVGRGEQVEAAVSREIKEETNLDVVEIQFNASQFYEKNNVLMVNFACRVKSAASLSCNEEIEAANWFSIAEARQAIYPNSLAQKFLDTWLDKAGY